MRETKVDFDPGWGELVDVDILDSGDWVALFRAAGELTLRTPRRSCPAPGGISFPKVRCLDGERVIVVDSLTSPDRSNAWIVRTETGALTSFFAGDGIEDVLASREAIVITYFDEGVFGNLAPVPEGVTVFDDRGNYRAGYRSQLGSSSVEIADCYAACWVDDTRVAFLPYTEFPVVTWDVRSFEQSVVDTPLIVHGSHAISRARDAWLFFGSYQEKPSMFRWEPGALPERLGEHSGMLRGLRGGRFLECGANGFTILEPTLEREPR